VVRRLALLGLLVCAAALRFTGLGWGLRHRPPLDERFFVSNAVHMLARGNLDHGFYQYPGLFYYILAPALAWVHDPTHNPTTYLVARSLVAAFSVLTVALAYLLGRTLFGSVTGLVAAALVAVSPLEVRIAHEVRPDVVLECVTLWSFLLFRRLGPNVKGDLASGVVIGAATAVKFSGALVAVPYVTQRFLAPGPKLRRIFLAGITSLVSFALFSPYTLLRGPASLQGMDDQLSFHYVDRATDLGFLGTLREYGLVLVEALGWPALVLAGLALFVGFRAWRRWLPLLVLLLLTLLVFSTATITQDRFLIPVLAATAILAGPALEAIGGRSRLALAVVACVAVAPPLRTSIEYVRALKKPITLDAAADFIESHYMEGQVAMTWNAPVGLDPTRFESLAIGRLTMRTRLQARHADLVVVGPSVDPGMLAGFQRVFVAEPETRYSGSRIRIFAVPEPLRPRYERFDLKGARLSTSRGDLGIESLRDGDLTTVWRTEGSSPGDWVQIDLPEARLLGRIEILLPQGDEDGPDEIEVYASKRSARLSRCPSLPGRPSYAQQRPPVSQVFLLPEVSLSTLRLVQAGRRQKPWAISELRLDVYKP